MEEIIQQIHDKLDELIVSDPIGFPNGENFINLLETFLQSLVNDNDIDSWDLYPMSSDGYKIIITKGDLTEEVVRNPDGGKVS